MKKSEYAPNLPVILVDGKQQPTPIKGITLSLEPYHPLKDKHHYWAMVSINSLENPDNFSPREVMLNRMQVQKHD